MGDIHLVDSVGSKSRTMQSVLICCVLAFALACGGPTSPTPPGDSFTFTFDFSNRPEGWLAGFADYPVYMENQMVNVADYRTLPSPLDESKSALYISGINYSGNLFMFYKKQVFGLVPNALYDASFFVEIASNVPRGCFGIGGPPGESVFVKLGASGIEPQRVLTSDRYVLNVDKGNQSQGGAAAAVVGDIANSIPCQAAPGGGLLYRWELKILTSPPAAVRLRTAPDGSMWVLAGTDSGFDGRTELYYTKLSATFRLAQ